jgi:PAS domain S-box-containing protein
VARALFEQSPFSTVLYDTAGRIVAVNAAFQRLFGLTPDAIPADYSVLADPQLERAGHLAAVRRAFDGDVVALPPVFYDAAAIEGGGRRSWTQGHFFPMRDADGAVTGVVLVHVDLTERMDADEARRQSEERLRVALDAGRMGAWEWDVAGGRVHWSDTLQRIHGLVPGTFGGTFDESQADIHPDDRERVLGQIAHSLEGGAHQLEYRIVPPDGEVRWLEARGELFRDADGRPSRMLGVCMDVTERKHAEAERDAAQRGSRSRPRSSSCRPSSSRRRRPSWRSSRRSSRCRPRSCRPPTRSSTRPTRRSPPRARPRSTPRRTRAASSAASATRSWCTTTSGASGT